MFAILLLGVCYELLPNSSTTWLLCLFVPVVVTANGQGGLRINVLRHVIIVFMKHKNLLHEMLQVARECSGRDPSDLQLSYGEFCLFSRELKSCYQNQPPKSPSLSKTPTESSSPSRIRRPDRNMSKSTPHYQVFLGGSCNPTTWRQDVAIPMLSKYGISYYNPQVSHWKAELLEKEYQAKRNASVLFFVFDSLTRNVASMVEAGYMAGRRRKLVLVIDNYSGPGQRINGEPISEAEYNELSEGLKMVHDLVERQGIPVFSEVNHALTCTAKIVHENISPQDLSIADKVQPVKYPYVQLGDKLLKLRDAFVNMNTSRISLADANVVFKVVTNRELTKDELLMIVQSKKGVNAQDINKSTDTPVQDFHLTFQEFCCVVAEFDNQPIESRRMWNLLTQSLISPIQKFVVSNGQGARDVYLGGSQGPRISWRENVAIPLLQKNGLSYHVPSPNSFAEGLPPVEANRLDNSKVLFFTITSNSRGVAQMALASYYIGLGYNVVLCLQKLTEGTVINGEELSKLAIDDYNRGRSYLEDQAIKERIPVFSDIEEAMECVVQKCKAR